jgi:hypothetical protein
LTFFLARIKRKEIIKTQNNNPRTKIDVTEEGTLMSGEVKKAGLPGKR